MKKKVINGYLLVVLLIGASYVKAQSTDEIINKLKEELKTNPDSKRKAILYGDLTWYFLNVSLDSALVYGEKAKTEAEKLNDSTLIAQAYSDFGAVHFRNGNYKESKNNYLKSYTIRKKQKDIAGLAKLNINLANVYLKNNDYKNAYKNFLGAITYFESIGNDAIVSETKSNVGILFFEMKNYKKAIQYLNEALPFQIENKQDNKLTNSYLTLGNIYLQIKDTTKALQYLDKSLNAAKRIGDKYAMSRAYNNIGLILTAQNKHKQAEKILSKTNNLKKEYNSDIENSKVKLNSVAELLRTQKFLKAYSILLEVKKDFEKIQSKEDLIIVYNNLVTTHTRFKNSDSTLFYFNKYKQLNELLSEKQVSKQIIELETKYQTEKKEKKLLLANNKLFQNQVALQKEKLAVQTKNNAILLISIGSGFILLLGYGIFRKKQLEQKAFLVAEKNKQRELLAQAVIEAEETERKRIASDLHDGVGQLFSAVKMNLSGLFDRIDIKKGDDKFLAEKTMALVDESCKEVRVISHKMMPNFLLKSGIAADIKSFIEKIDENTLKISFESSGFKDQLEFNEEVVLYRVIQELINNVIKHAKANELNISLQKTTKTITVQIADNGIGFDYDNAISKGGLGLKNILIRIEYLKGKVRFEPNNPSGTKVLIEIPIA